MSDKLQKPICVSIFQDGTIIPWDITTPSPEREMGIRGGVVFFRTSTMQEAETLIRRLCKLRVDATTDVKAGGYYYAGSIEDPWLNDVMQIDRLAARFAHHAERLELQTHGGFKL